ncbi:MD-2-related lipid-recognition protein ROSY1-like [Triticum urartu]|uniref:MD-2-related lipid-recognition domain-containing protein n=2 Tax=Triticum TaxID=4564 RepID=A0A8R7Q0H8_TRIUA|nr:MD-2-related lipid-recognition protein ROSY1-like [Triticum urartu]
MATKQSLLAASAACISLLLLLTLASSLTAFEFCDKGKDYPVRVSGVKMVPDLVIGGEPNFFTIYASTNKTITQGKLVSAITCGSFHVHSEAEDICTLTSCPATADFEVTHQLDMPSTDPNGAYAIRMEMFGENDEELSCISLGYNLTGGLGLELNITNLFIA